MPSTAVDFDPFAGTAPDKPILLPAIKTKDGEVKAGTLGDHHDDIDATGQRGFVDQSGAFLNRKEAGRVAKDAGLDVPENLHSENLNQALGIEGKNGKKGTPVDFDPFTPASTRLADPDKFQGVLHDYTAPAKGAWEALKKDFQDATNLKDAPTGFWDAQKKEFDRFVATGKTVKDAAELALAPFITGPLNAFVARPIKEVGDILAAPTGQKMSMDTALGIAGSAMPRSAAPIAQSMAAARPANALVDLKNMAINKVNARAAQDGITAQQVLDAQTAAQATGDKITLADLGKKNIKGLAGNVYRAPGEASGAMDTFLDTRESQSTQALKNDIESAVAKGSTYKTQEALNDSRAKIAGPLYDDAYAANQKLESPELSKIVETPAGRKALSKAVEKMQNDRTLVGKPDPELTALVKELSERGAMDNPQTGIGVARGLKLRTWDYVKRSLDDQIDTARRAGEKDDARILTGMKNDLVRELDKADTTAVRDPTGKIVQPGKYAQARAAYGGPSQSSEAMEMGKAHFSRKDSNDQILAEFSKLSPSDREFYRLGAAESKIDAVNAAQDSADKSKRVINSEKDRARFRMLFDNNQDAQNFIDSVERKRQMTETRQKIKGGSQTAERGEEDRSAEMEAAGHAVKSVGHALSGNMLASISSAVRAKRDLGLLKNPALNQEIGNILTNSNLAGALNIAGPTLLAPLQRSQALSNQIQNRLLSLTRVGQVTQGIGGGNALAALVGRNNPPFVPSQGQSTPPQSGIGLPSIGP